MLFRKKRPYTTCVDLSLLKEPAYLFSENGSFISSNDVGLDFLEDMGVLKNKSLKHYDDFMMLFLSRFDLSEKQIFHHEHWTYKFDISKADDRTLVRFMPQQGLESVTRVMLSLNIMPWGIITVNMDDNQRIVYCNPKAGHYLRAYHESVLGFALDDAFRVCGLPDNLSSFISSSKESYSEFSIENDGKQQWIRLHFVPFFGDFRYCMVLFQDISEEKIREEHFSQAQRLEALGQLAGGVAHDFNNILSIIDGYTRLIKRNSMEEEQIFLSNISKAVERGADLTSRLLTFGRHRVVRETTIDLCAIVRDQELLLKPLMDASVGLILTTKGQVYMDAQSASIGQILMNLCVNARDAMAETGGGNLIVSAYGDDEGFAVLEVIDTGVGMNPDVQKRMFDPFFTTKEQGKGTGLGLSMVYSMVQDMGGSIDVVSKENEGTAIKIKWPISHKRPESESYNRDNSGDDLSGMTVLIAEDEPELLTIVSGMMEECGARVLRACDGNEALAVSEEYDGPIDMLLTDVVMPDLNGVRLAELFSSCRPESKIMFMSGYPCAGQMAKVKVPEGYLLMAKPVKFENLKAVVRSVLNEQNDNQKSPYEDIERMKKITGEWSIRT